MILTSSDSRDSTTTSLNYAREDYFRIIENLKGYSKSTITSYRTDFDQFSRFLEKQKIGCENITVITPAHLEDFCLYLLKEKHLHINTVHRKKDSLSSLFKHCVKRGWVKSNPVEKIDIACKKKNYRKVFLDNNQTRQFILTKVSVKGYDYHTLKAVKFTLCFTGMRNKEIRKLNWQDIDLDKNLIRIFDSKNTNKKNNPDGLDREIPICTSLRDALIKIRSDRGPVFKNNKGIRITKDALKNLVDRSAKIFKRKIILTPHCMRHNFSSHLEKNGATVSDIGFVLGHKPNSTTSGYIHSNLDRIARFIQQFDLSVMGGEFDRSMTKSDNNHLNVSAKNEFYKNEEKDSLIHQKHTLDKCYKENTSNILISPKKIREAELIWYKLNVDKPMPANFLLGYVLNTNNV